MRKPFTFLVRIEFVPRLVLTFKLERHILELLLKGCFGERLGRSSVTTGFGEMFLHMHSLFPRLRKRVRVPLDCGGLLHVLVGKSCRFVIFVTVPGDMLV